MSRTTTRFISHSAYSILILDVIFVGWIESCGLGPDPAMVETPPSHEVAAQQTQVATPETRTYYTNPEMFTPTSKHDLGETRSLGILCVPREGAVSVRHEPSTNSVLLGELPIGAGFTTHERSSDAGWLHGTAEGMRGWVPARDLWCGNAGNLVALPTVSIPMLPFHATATFYTPATPIPPPYFTPSTTYPEVPMEVPPDAPPVPPVPPSGFVTPMFTPPSTDRPPPPRSSSPTWPPRGSELPPTERPPRDPRPPRQPTVDPIPPSPTQSFPPREPPSVPSVIPAR